MVDAPRWPGRLLVMGAGSVGGYLGGMLAAAGAPVTLVGRPRVVEALTAHGLTLSDLDGTRRVVAPGEFEAATRVEPGSHPALVLLCVKSAATAAAAADLGAALAAGTPVLSMQNGVDNVAVAQAAAPHLRVLAGMVPYNIAELSPGHLHRGTGGVLAAQDDPALRDWLAGFGRAGLPLQLHADLRPIQWGKLLLNLNNPVNALSGMPLREELLQRDCRRCLAALIDEAIDVLERAGIRPAQVTALAPRRFAALLRLPTPLFRLVAARALRIDAKARSSMADDLRRGRETEIDALCGAVVALARAVGADAPLNRRMVELIHAVDGAPPPRLAPRALLQALTGPRPGQS